MREKEKLEDLIAEREYAAAQKAEAKPAEGEARATPGGARLTVELSRLDKGGAAPSPLMGEGWGGGEN